MYLAWHPSLLRVEMLGDVARVIPGALRATGRYALTFK